MRNRLHLLVPAGALAALLAAGCADDPDPPFAPTGTGTVSGRLFFDADNNGFFSPVGGDTALRAVTVELRERASARVLATTTTDDDGEFSFTAPPGTHDIFVAVDEAADLVVCANPARASVYIGEQAFVAVPAKRGCVIRIREVKQTAVGEQVTVAGVVTAGQGTYRTDNIYLQDPTGGMQVFRVPVSLALQPGDSVELTGTLAYAFGSASNEFQINDPIVAPNIRRGGETPDPKVTTAGALAALTQTSDDIGRLATVRAVTVGAFSSGGGRNATITDATGSTTMRLDGNVFDVLPPSRFAAGRCYDITGIIGFFGGGAQFKPRGPADVAEVPCP